MLVIIQSLTTTVAYGHYQIVELLLKEHADINTQEEDG